MSSRKIKSLRKTLVFMAILSSWVFCMLPASAVPVACHGQFFNPASIDRSGFLPITVGSTTLEDGNLPDTENPKNPVCVCGDPPDVHQGGAMGYWEPMALIDVTRTPYCMVSLGGAQWSGPTEIDEGTVDTSDDSQANSFYNVHYHNYPLIEILFGDLLGGSCSADGDFKGVYASEDDATWDHSRLSDVLFPETKFFENPAMSLFSQNLCLADSAAAHAGLPRDDLFFCAGSQGFMYPVTGRVISHEGMAQATLLIVERAMMRLQRLGWVLDTSKDNLCSEEYGGLRPPKSRYRYEMVYPEQGPVKPFGYTTQYWWTAVNKAHPLMGANGDDTAYLIWRKRNCCSYD